jgi:diadenosine tetraphosphate (Ap4A) HIT family hydrolase
VAGWVLLHQNPIVSDWRADRIGSAIRGENPTVMARLPASFAVMGDPQWLPGYSVLLVDRIGVERLSDLPVQQRLEFLASMERLGEAVEVACAQADSAFRRVNLEILGNADPFLHAHVWPRYDWEPADLVHRPVWLYPRERWSDPDTALGPRHDDLRRAIVDQLATR